MKKENKLEILNCKESKWYIEDENIYKNASNSDFNKIKCKENLYFSSYGLF